MGRAADPISQRERRSHRRKPAGWEAGVRLGQDEWARARLVDMSVGGVLLVLDAPLAAPLALSAQYEIRFCLTTEQGEIRIEAGATVLRCEVDQSEGNAVRAAMAFIRISEDDQAHIARFGETLFRPEALAARNATRVGNVVFTHPALFSRLTLCVAVFGLALVALFIFGSHARRSTVAGQLVPDSGLIKIHAQQSGVVTGKRINEGQVVRSGDILYTLSGERHGSEGAIEAMMSARVASRRKSLQDELEKTRQLHQEEGRGLEMRVLGMRSELAALEQQARTQHARLAMAEDITRRYKGLLAQDYVSYEQAQHKQEEMLDQRARLHDLERSKTTIRRELAALENELGGLNLRQSNQLAALERAITDAEQELTESDARRKTVIVAPEDGTIATSHAEPGQSVAAGAVLASIVPLNSRLEAQLYAPSRAIAFVKPGSKVLIRYEAYPFQKFGVHEGLVTAVAKTALPISELVTAGSGAYRADGPVYRIKVQLPSQTLTAQGAPLPLQAGMLLEADLMQHRRQLYEWVFEPLSSLVGKL